VYGMAEMALIPLFALASWKVGWTYAPPDENVCVVLTGNYQPEAPGPSSSASTSRFAAAASDRAQDMEALNPKENTGALGLLALLHLPWSWFGKSLATKRSTQLS